MGSGTAQRQPWPVTTQKTPSNQTNQTHLRKRLSWAMQGRAVTLEKALQILQIYRRTWPTTTKTNTKLLLSWCVTVGLKHLWAALQLVTNSIYKLNFIIVESEVRHYWLYDVLRDVCCTIRTVGYSSVWLVHFYLFYFCSMLVSCFLTGSWETHTGFSVHAFCMLNFRDAPIQNLLITDNYTASQDN